MVTEFIFMGITQDPQLQVIFFVIFLLVYLVNVVGNVGMIILIITDTQLHTSMYFFLCNLSFVDLSYSSAIASRMLADFLTKHKVISFSSCAIQFAFFIGFVDAECYVLAAMAYDRFVAICQPLRYSALMSKQVCLALMLGFYLAGLVSLVSHTALTFSLSYCGFNILNHFFCEIPPLLALSCSDTYISEILLFSLCSSLNSAPSSSSLSPMPSSSSQLSECTQLKAALRLSPPVGLTSLASHFFMVQSCLCT